MTEQPSSRVAITDVDMPFASMVRFMVKWAIAAVPALLILMILGAVFWGVLAGLTASIVSRTANRSVSGTESVVKSSGDGTRHSAAASTSSASATPSDPAATAYLPSVEVKNARVSKDVLDRTGVFGEIKNTGSRTLKNVEITIYCLGDDGQPIFEKSYEPVRAGAFDTDVSLPLKAHYSRQFGVKMEDAPSEWHRQVRVEVTHIEFE